MSRTSLRQKIEGMEVMDVMRVPKDYEETTIRNTASRLSTILERKYRVSKNRQTKSITITRTA